MSHIKIMIVEDDPIIGADLEDRLSEMGYQLSGPFDKGEDAFAALNAAKPDLIIMDVNLAGKWNGIETAKKIMSIQALPIIYLTGNSDDYTFAEAKQTQPAAFLSKPFRGRDLKHAIELAILQTQAPKGGTVDSLMEVGQTVLLTDRIFIKNKDRLERIYLSDILWVEADDYYCRLATKSQEILLTQTLRKFEEKIENLPDFCRVHRSHLVNVRHIEQIGENYLYIGRKEIPISKAARILLLNRLNTI